MSSETETEILKIIHSLVTTGRKTLAEDKMKALKNICKQSDAYVSSAYYGLLTQLRKDHSEIRYSTLLIINEFIMRSSAFRKLFENDLDEFLELVMDTNPEKPLPLPAARAKELKLKGLEFMKAWVAKFGQKYLRLELAFTYLKKCKKVDFNDMEARSAVEREREAQERERQEQIINDKVNRVKGEIQEISPEISNALTQMENCFRLLIPHPEEFFSASDFQSTDETRSSDSGGQKAEASANDTLRQHGLYDMKKTITIDVQQESDVTVRENEDTQPIIENLKDIHKELRCRYLPTITRWLKVLTKGNNCIDSLKQVIDLKRMIESSFEKFRDLNIEVDASTFDSDEDDDFEEVEDKEGYEEDAKSDESYINVQPSCSKSNSKPLNDVEKANIFKFKHSKDDMEDPTSALSTIKKAMIKFKDVIAQVCTLPEAKSKLNQEKSEMLDRAPILPYDIDLYHWEEEKPLVPEMVEFDSLHKFWESKDDKDKSDALEKIQIASLRTRKIEFGGKFEPVKWACRAPLPSGKLCPRKDRFKCPFHGKIIKRDELGNPSDSTGSYPGTSQQSSNEIPSTSSQPAVPEWQDPKLLEEIHAATGIDLKIPVKGKRKNKGLEGGLTNIKNPKISTRSRLSKKIIKRYKHYSKKLDDMEKKKFDDKFGDQWNYY